MSNGRLRAFARAAMRSLPRDFRRLFGDEVLSHTAAEPDRFAHNLFDILKGGLAMRIDDVLRDVKYAVARLSRAPLFVAVVILTFALGIGANVAVFSAVNAIVLRPLPFPNADRLVAITSRKGGKWDSGPLSAPDVGDLRAQLRGVTSISAIASSRAQMKTAGAVPKTVHGAAVTSTFFGTIAAVPEIGRLFQPADARGQHDVVISDRLWRTVFSADPAVAAKRVELDGVSYAIVGVARPDLQVPNPHPLAPSLAQLDYFTVMPDASAPSGRAGGSLGVIAALAPGVSVAQINAELLVASRRLAQLYPRDDARTTFSARSLSEQIVGPVASTLWLVLIAVFGILLIACANVANLIATRWSAREREVAIRRALGASSRRIAAQLFIETGILAACGGVTGVALAYACLRFIPLTALDAMPRAGTISIDATTLLFALAMVCVTTVFAGLAPVLSLGRAELQLVLNSAGRGGDASRGHRLRSALVVAEVAIAVALVISSGLVIRSYLALVSTPLGIRPEGVYESDFLGISRQRYPTLQSQTRAEQKLLARLEAQPGIDAAALAINFPLSGLKLAFDTQVLGDARPLRQVHLASLNTVSSSYFRALGIPLLRGRALESRDSVPGARLVIIVNQAFADKYFEGDGINQQLDLTDTPAKVKPATVVGVVGNAREELAKAPSPTVYVPVGALAFFGGSAVVVHAPQSNLAAVRKEIQYAFASVFPESEPPAVYAASDRVADATQTERSAATLLGALAVVPLLLALSGIFGVVSFSIALRSSEFGIRIAIGARARHILADVLRRSLSTSVLGVAIGTLLAALAARSIAPHIVVSALDPLTFGLVVTVVVVCATAAAMVPALRATQVDPVVALRYE